MVDKAEKIFRKMEMEWRTVPYLVGSCDALNLHPSSICIRNDFLSPSEIGAVHTVSSLLVNAFHAWSTDYERYYRPPSPVIWALIGLIHLDLGRTHDALRIPPEIYWSGLRLPRPTTAA